MKERRKVQRKNLVHYLAVTNTKTNTHIGHAVNISEEGIMLISEKPIEINVIFQLRMSLPEEIRGSRNFEFSAESKWWEKNVKPGFYNAGFRLIDVPQEGIQVIKKLIEKFCIPEKKGS